MKNILSDADKEKRNAFLRKYVSAIVLAISIISFFFIQPISKTMEYSIGYAIVLFSFFLIASLGVLLFELLKSKKNTTLLYNTDYSELDINSFFNIRFKKELEKKYGSKSLSLLMNPLSAMFSNLEFPDELFEEELETLKNKFIKKYITEYEYIPYYENLLHLEQKIKNQIERLIKNSNLNLIIGISITAVSILIIATSILLQDKSDPQLASVISHYLPRISTVIIIEIISFFFLKLYKKNLDDIKYFQNEITNLDFKIASYKAALLSKDTELLKVVTDSFSKTERNIFPKEDIKLDTDDNKLDKISKTLDKIIALVSNK